MKDTTIIGIIACVVILGVFAIVLFGRPEDNNRSTNELKEGKYTSICTLEYKEDNDIVLTKTVTNYDKNRIAINMKVDTTYTFDDEKEFEEKINSLKDNSILYEANKGARYEYKINKKRKSYTITFIYEKIEMNKDSKDRYKLEKIVKDSEENDETCDVIGITRREIGL